MTKEGKPLTNRHVRAVVDKKPSTLWRILRALGIFIAKIFFWIILAMIGAFAWVLIYGTLTTFTDYSIHRYMALLVALVFAGLFITVFVFWRKSSKLLLRWTAKASMSILPFMILGSTMMFWFATLPPIGDQVDSAGGIIGNQVEMGDVELTNEALLRETNLARSDNSKPALRLNDKLNVSALNKCRDMVANDYWSHDDKQGREPWRFFADAGYVYHNAGENLAYGMSDESMTVEEWMNSQTHRANILGDYQEVGFGICKSDNYVGDGPQVVIVQHFGTPGQQNTPSSSSSPATRSIVPTAYVPPHCTQEVIPRSTDYVEVDYMYVGETESYTGWDGYRETCTADSTGYKPDDYISKPFNDVVYVGTGVRPPSQTNQPNYSQCSQFSGTGAYQACIDAVNRQHRP